MRTIRRNKQWAGNICLAIFAALLFSMVFVGPGAAQAAAPPPTWEGIPDGELTIPHDEELLALEIRLQAATMAHFEPLWYQLLVGDIAYETVYLSQYIYDAVYFNVYDAVYELVYFVYSDLFVNRIDLQFAIWHGINPLWSVSIVFEDPPPEVVFGDLTGEGDVTAADATLVLRAVVRLVDLSEQQHYAADVNGDTEITSSDATLILRHVVGLITQFPVEELAMP